MTTLSDIEQVLEKDIRPHLRAHGGDIRSHSFENGVYRFWLLGQCSNCPSAYLTTESVIAEQIQDKLPDVKDVILLCEISQELLAQAQMILRRG